MKTAVCTIVRNEQSSVLQWIAFHRLIGFDTILLLDDRSTDLTASLARWAAASHDVRVSSLAETGDTRQADAYFRVCRDNRDEFDRIAFIDADEYLVPRMGGSLAQLLSRCAGHDCIAVPWLMFGSSHHVGKPAGLLIAEFQRRSVFAFPPNRHVKSIVRPTAVTATINPHAFAVQGSCCLPDGSPATWDSPGVLSTYPDGSPWMLHHYFTRSRIHWGERMRRGQLGQFVRTWSDFHYYDRNEVLDGTAAAFSPQVKRLLAAMHGDGVVPTVRSWARPGWFGDLARPRQELVPSMA